MMDALADAAGADPIDYRMRHLMDLHSKRVLSRLKSTLAAAGEPNAGVGRGIAYAQYKNSMTRVAVAVDVHVSDTGATRLDRAWLVADAGRVVDPDGLRAQLEGGFLQGASWALHESVSWGRAGRDRLDWDSYPVIRFDNVPHIEIDVLAGDAAQSRGAGEASPSPTVAAIANGIFNATGLRLHRMPFDADAIMQAALNS
jgi:CO/xanthine dehydrogenase Mo-binding subunit